MEQVVVLRFCKGTLGMVKQGLVMLKPFLWWHLWWGMSLDITLERAVRNLNGIPFLQSSWSFWGSSWCKHHVKFFTVVWVRLCQTDQTVKTVWWCKGFTINFYLIFCPLARQRGVAITRQLLGWVQAWLLHDCCLETFVFKGSGSGMFLRDIWKNTLNKLLSWCFGHYMFYPVIFSLHPRSIRVQACKRRR